MDGEHTQKRVRLHHIWPDVLQARRVIPAIIRRSWQGDPREVREVLCRWHKAVEYTLSIEINVGAIVRNQAPIPETDGDLVLVDHYCKLLELARSIHMNGLTNPITVIENAGGDFIIETGERRWLAHQLLSIHTREAWYTHIPARILSEFDVWRQADENGLRVELNAIEKARQLARLIMTMWEHDRGVKFDNLDFFIENGASDRGYYAQALKFRVKRGMAQRVASAMGLHSYSHISRYKNLLNIPDEVWELADAEDWTEGRIRAYMIDYAAEVVTTSPESEPSVPESDVNVPTGKVKVKEHYRGGHSLPNGEVADPVVCAVAVAVPGLVQVFDSLIEVAANLGDVEAIDALRDLGGARPGDVVNRAEQVDRVQHLLERVGWLVCDHSQNVEGV